MLGQKNMPAACPKQRKLLLSIFPTIPDPIRAIFYIIKTHIFITKIKKYQKFSINMLKKIKIVAKAKLG